MKSEIYNCEICGDQFIRKSKLKRLCDSCNREKIRSYQHDWYMKNVHNNGLSKRIVDESGKKYGRLTVLEYAGQSKNKAALFKCKCDCGKEIIAMGSALRGGHIKSCGCYQKEVASLSARKYNKSDKYKQPDNTKHGMTHTRIYQTWCGMKKRCYNKNQDHYECYGGIGITVCDEWLNDFSAFYKWAIENGYSDDLTIDRIDVRKGYCPENCRWVTQKEQMRNRRTTLYYEHDGQIKPFIVWCEQFGINYKLAHARYKKGYPFEKIFQRGVI